MKKLPASATSPVSTSKDLHHSTQTIPTDFNTIHVFCTQKHFWKTPIEVEMSKSEVKKYIKSLERSSLEELVMDLYSARKEAKEYLEFYANPDEDGKLDEYKKIITEEFPAADRFGKGKHFKDPTQRRKSDTFHL